MTGVTDGLGGLEGEFWRVLFVMIRIGAALLAAPLFGAVSVPAQARVVLAGAFAVLVCNWISVAPPPQLFSLGGMLTVCSEILIGLSLGFVLQIAFAAPLIAAELVGGAMGMSIASTADPVSGGHSPVLGQYFSTVMVLVFLAAGAHLHWLSLVMESYRAFPPGAPWFDALQLPRIIDFVATMFATGLSMAFPVLLILLLVQLACGVIGRAAPSLNFFALALPLGMLAGIAALILAAPVNSERDEELVDQALSIAAEMLER